MEMMFLNRLSGLRGELPVVLAHLQLRAGMERPVLLLRGAGQRGLVLRYRGRCLFLPVPLGPGASAGWRRGASSVRNVGQRVGSRAHRLESQRADRHERVSTGLDKRPP